MSTIEPGADFKSSPQSTHSGDLLYWGPLMAGGMYVTLPALVLSFALQKYLIRGMRLSY